MFVVAGAAAIISAGTPSGVSAATSASNARELSAITRRSIQLGVTIHAAGSTDAFIINDSDYEFYQNAVSSNSGVPIIPFGSRPASVKVGCNWWKFQPDGTYWETRDSYAGIGTPDMVQSLADLDRKSLQGSLTVSDHTADGEAFLLEQPTLNSQLTTIAVVRDGRLRTLTVRDGIHHLTIMLGDYGKADVTAPPSSEISKVQTGTGHC